MLYPKLPSEFVFKFGGIFLCPFFGQLSICSYEAKFINKFIGFVGELHITPTKRWTALKPKNCTVCGVEYVPRSGISKYCPACAKKIQREKSNESKRRSRERNRQACIELSAKNDRLMLACTWCVLLQYLLGGFGSVFPQCGLMVFPGVVIVSR